MQPPNGFFHSRATAALLDSKKVGGHFDSSALITGLFSQSRSRAWPRSLGFQGLGRLVGEANDWHPPCPPPPTVPS
mgnify:FL=1